jgi:hypothetical protein
LDSVLKNVVKPVHGEFSFKLKCFTLYRVYIYIYIYIYRVYKFYFVFFHGNGNLIYKQVEQGEKAQYVSFSLILSDSKHTEEDK